LSKRVITIALIIGLTTSAPLKANAVPTDLDCKSIPFILYSKEGTELCKWLNDDRIGRIILAWRLRRIRAGASHNVLPASGQTSHNGNRQRDHRRLCKPIEH
ncbi:hypothetical protein PMAYCL1PPCAC_32270, partial [Pristionchus mayeri]